MSKLSSCISFSAALVVLIAACGGAPPPVGQATVENAQAAVVVLEGDRSEAGEQVETILDISVPDRERLSEDFNARSVFVQTEGGPSGAFYVQFIFQRAADSGDRREFRDRVLALGLDEPIWLGGNDPWPFCAEQPCDLVRDDGTFP